MTVQAAPTLSADEKRWRIVTATMRRNGFAPDALIETLHCVQSAFGYLDDTALRFVAHELHVPQSLVYGVATFYHAFTLKPEGHHRCILCQGTACYIKGSRPFSRPLRRLITSLLAKRQRTWRYHCSQRDAWDRAARLLPQSWMRTLLVT